MRTVIVAALVFVIAACGAPQKAAEKTAGTCVETAAIKAVEADLTTAITEGTPQWEQLALATLTSIAPDAVVCVVQLVKALIESKTGVSPTSGDAAAVARAQKLIDDLQSHKVAVPSAKTSMLDPAASGDFIGGTIP